MWEQDSSIMDVVSGQFSVIEINPGFSETESLSLFSSYLKVIDVKMTTVRYVCKIKTSG